MPDLADPRDVDGDRIRLEDGAHAKLFIQAEI